jgi:hypothetical protein
MEWLSSPDFLVPSIRPMPLSLYTQYKCIKSFTNSFSKNFFSSVINIASIKKVLPPFFSVWLEFYPVAFKKLTFFLASAFMSDCLISVRSSRLKKKNVLPLLISTRSPPIIHPGVSSCASQFHFFNEMNKKAKK